jgi:hypothetical protein
MLGPEVRGRCAVEGDTVRHLVDYAGQIFNRERFSRSNKPMECKFRDFEVGGQLSIGRGICCSFDHHFYQFGAKDSLNTKTLLIKAIYRQCLPLSSAFLKGIEKVAGSFRLDSPDLPGSGLYCNGNLVHLLCFPAARSPQEASHWPNQHAFITDRRNRTRNR